MASIIVLSLLISAVAARGDDTAALFAPQAPPATPTGFAVAGATRTSITLAWDDAADETGYTVYRWNGSAYVALASVGANVVGYTDSVACNKTFYYKLSAFNASGESAQTSGNLAGSSTGCFAADEYEPDNSAAQAVTLAPAAAQNHTIVPASDVDWFKFTLDQTSGIVLTTAGTSGNTVLTLMLADQTPIMINDDYGTTFFSQISWTCAMGGLPAGSYYAKVESFNNAGTVGGYDMSLVVAACATPVVSATPSSTAVISPTSTAIVAPSSTAVVPPSSTAVVPPSSTATGLPTATATASTTATAPPTATSGAPTLTSTATATAPPTATSGAPTLTSTATASTTATAIPTATATASTTATAPPTATSGAPTLTASTTATAIPTATATASTTTTAIPTATSGAPTLTASTTATAPPTATSGAPTLTSTATATATATNTATAIPTATATATASTTVVPATPTATAPLLLNQRAYVPLVIRGQPAAAGRSAHPSVGMR